MKRIARLEISNTKNCFVSTSWPQSKDEMKVLKIELCPEESIYLSTRPFSGVENSGASKDTVMRVPRLLARVLCLEDKNYLCFQELPTSSAKKVLRAAVSCLSSDDFEILEANTENVTSHLLDQIRVVFPGLTFPYWISPSMHIKLKIDKLEPNCEFGLIAPDTEVVIPSLARESFAAVIDYRKKDFLPPFRIHPVNLTLPETSILSDSVQFKNIYNGFTYLEYFHGYLEPSQLSNKLNSYICAKITSVDESEKEIDAILKLFFIETLDFHQDLVLNLPKTNPASVFLHPYIISSHPFPIKSYISIVPVEEKDFEAFCSNEASLYFPIDAASLKRSSDQDVPFIGFEQQVETIKDFILSSLSLGTDVHRAFGPYCGSILITGKEGSGKSTLCRHMAHFFSGHPYYCQQEFVSCAQLRGKKPENIEKLFSSVIQRSMKYAPAIVFLDDLDVLTPALKSDQENHVQNFFYLRIFETLSDILKSAEGTPIVIVCTAQSLDSLNPVWKSKQGFHFFHSFLHIPAPNKVERLSIFLTCVRRYLTKSGNKDLEDGNKKREELVIKEARMSHHLAGNESTRHHDEDHYYTRSRISSKVVNRTKRKMSKKKFNEDDDHDDNGDEDEGDITLPEYIVDSLSTIHDLYCGPGVIEKVARKWAVYITASNEAESKMHHHHLFGGTEEAFKKIVEEEINFFDYNESKHRNESCKLITWEKIGGLAAVKTELKKILEWPTKYAPMFENAPVKMPCSVLLYGYPGTGKTIIGLSIPSRLNGAQFIHVKGPELLSKYIGASEQGVKDVFRRAKDSRPCVLFFDEFDSLVPRRGHDSTGVTDRVVNQFLTEMDGVDGGVGEGVYLVAATSRPDLIDPAILRPGRLDKHLFFDFPNEEDREDILRVISNEINIKQDINESEWKEIARRLEGFTGADVHSLMYSSQMEAIQEELNALKQKGGATVSARNKEGNRRISPSEEKTKNSGNFINEFASCPQRVIDGNPKKESEEGNQSGLPVMNIAHVNTALESFKNSLHGEELLKFKYIYERFQTPDGEHTVSSSSPLKNQEWTFKEEKRATLA